MSKAEFKARFVEREEAFTRRLLEGWQARRQDQDTTEYAAQLAAQVVTVLVEIVYE